MNDTKYVWAWVAGVVVVIAIILGFWWWGNAYPYNGQEAGYAATSTDALTSSNAPTGSVSEQAETGTVAEVVESLSGTSRFARMLSQTEVSAQLRGAGPYTVFVPADSGFTLLPPGSLNLTATQERRLVEYHIVAGRAIDVNAAPSGTIQALSRDMLNFSYITGDKSARINSAVALRAYKASNGIVYVINEVLLPPLNP